MRASYPRLFVVLSLVCWANPASAATHKVGPSSATKTLSTAFFDTLKAGDVVELEGDHTYELTKAIQIKTSGTAEAPITLRGMPKNGKRPLLSGNKKRHHILDVRANYIIVENVDLTQGDFCYRHNGANNVYRNGVIHHCRNGILGADEDSGSLLVEYAEIHNCGEGDSHHQIYMSTDGDKYPDATFRLQYTYIHDGVGGNNVKTRSTRNEIYYNWIEGAFYHEIELIGKDYDPIGEILPREDSDVVGNVVVSNKEAWAMIRVGGDTTGATSGRYRFVNNTLVSVPTLGVIFRLFTRLESIEMHNNIIYTGGGATEVIRYQSFDPGPWSVTDHSEEMVWSTGKRLLVGSNNWVDEKAIKLPDEWTGTLRGSDPGFEDVASYDLRPKKDCVLVDAGNQAPKGVPDYEFPKGHWPPAFSPPQRTAAAPGEATARIEVGQIDIGAFEYGTTPRPPPETDAGIANPKTDGGGHTTADAGVTPTGDAGIGGKDNGLDGGCTINPVLPTGLTLLALAVIGLVLVRRRQ